MASVVVEQEKFLDMMQEWISVPGVTDKGKLEVSVLTKEEVEVWIRDKATKLAS